MPDIFLVTARRRSLMLLLTLAGTAAALIASLLSPKLYLGTTTALPVNTLVNDKARIFNRNIEALYSEIGTADELDKMEGTARLDTVFLAVAAAHHLAAHYNLDTAAGDALEKAALRLRRSSDITRTGYGELNIKVWDRNNETAAGLANALLQTLNEIYERLQTANNRRVLQTLQEAYAEGAASLKNLQEKTETFETSSRTYTGSSAGNFSNDTGFRPKRNLAGEMAQMANKQKQLQEYADLINEYELAVKTTPTALLVVERARPSPWYDRPKTLRNVLIAFAASLLFSFLLAVFVESRKGGA